MTPPNRPIQLQIGERRFITSAATLNSAPFFEAFLKPEWGSEQPDGSFFLDVDPNPFEHILQYLRHGTAPLFYTRAAGFGFPKYAAVLAQADYFGLEALSAWIKNGKYLKAIKNIHSTRLDEVDLDLGTQATMDGSTEVEYHVRARTDKVYVCPRDLSKHRGNPGACGRQCRNAEVRDEEDRYQNEEVIMKTSISKTVTVDLGMLRIE